MARKKTDKKIPQLGGDFKEILVCRRSNLKPYTEIFIQEPENISQQNLGTIAGILEITDESEESSYIVNYLISVIKKEYFRKIKRGPIESFEAALHKANLALSKLAEHESLGWLGKMNAIILVIEKNNLHVSQTGNARALLLRGSSLTDISEGGVQEENSPNPLKTFVDVVSGKLEKNDKLIITTRHIFDIFSFEEIKKSALRFSPSEFTRFLKTALVNELEKAAVLIVDLDEKKEFQKTNRSKKKNGLNAFSQATFSKSSSKKDISKSKSNKVLDTKEKEGIVEEIKEQLAKNNGDYTDKKTGHIYIKEDHFIKENDSSWKNITSKIQEKTSSWQKNIKKASPLAKQSLNDFKKPNFASYLKSFFLKLISLLIITSRYIGEKNKIFFVWLWRKIKLLGFKIKENFLNYLASRKNKKISSEITPSELITKRNFSQVLSGLLSYLSPKFSKIKNSFSRLSTKQKIYASIIIALLLIIPFFVARKDNTSELKEETVKKEPVALPLEKDKNIVRVDNLETIYSGKEIKEVINLNNSIFVLEEGKIIFVDQNNESWDIPNDFSSAKIMTGMDDLNLLFLINSDNKIISFSPTTKKFQTNEISIPEGSEISNAGTYLTYIYLLDEKNNQIYRYPRDTGGFGEKTNWLKDSVSLKNIESIAITEDIFLTQDGKLLKFNRGEKQGFALENSATPIEVWQVYARPESQNIYILDKNNARIIKTDLEGKIISQYYNEALSDTKSFTIDEEKSLAYLAHGNNISRFEMK